MTDARLPIDAVRLRVWHRRLTYASTGLLVATGLAWLVLDVFAHGRADLVGPHPLAHPLLAAHGAVAMIASLAYGGVLATHVPRAWAVKRNRSTGWLIAAVLVVLIVSAWILYYASSESVRESASAIHWIVGLSIALLLPLHIAIGRRARRGAARASVTASTSFPTD